MSISDDFGPTIRLRRVAIGVTARALAREAGIKARDLLRFETMEQGAQIETRRKITAALQNLEARHADR